jgi:hypothetical protein
MRRSISFAWKKFFDAFDSHKYPVNLSKFYSHKELESTKNDNINTVFSLLGLSTVYQNGFCTSHTQLSVAMLEHS